MTVCGRCGSVQVRTDERSRWPAFFLRLVRLESLHCHRCGWRGLTKPVDGFEPEPAAAEPAERVAISEPESTEEPVRADVVNVSVSVEKKPATEPNLQELDRKLIPRQRRPRRPVEEILSELDAR